MSYNIDGGLLTIPTKLTGNTATTIFTADSTSLIASIVACDNAGGTPSVTLTLVDESAVVYNLRRAVALTAGVAFIFDTPFVLPQGWTLKATSSSASGLIDVLVTYVTSVAAQKSRPF